MRMLEQTLQKKSYFVQFLVRRLVMLKMPQSAVIRVYMVLLSIRSSLREKVLQSGMKKSSRFDYCREMHEKTGLS